MDLKNGERVWNLRGRRVPWLYLLLSPLFLLLFYSKGQASQQTPLSAAIDEFILRQMAAQRLPGLALAITQNGNVLYVQGYGTDGKGQPVTPQTQFFIASVSKSYTALAVMQLVEEGKIDLDAPVQAYLPEFTLADPGVASKITIRHLLNQTSGLSETGFPDMQLPQPESIAERVTSLRDARPVAPPGSEYHYFSPNYGTLARVVEVVSGQPFSEYLETRVFAPLGMQHTLSVVTSAEGKQKAEQLARGHLVAFGIPIAYPEAEGYLGGSGGVITTAEDIARFLIVQTNGGRFMDQALVTPESLAMMHTPPAGVEGNYAMGWTESHMEGLHILEHNGILSTFSADALLIPERGIGIALLYNVSSFPTISFGQPQIKNGLISLLTDRPVEEGRMSVGLWGWITGGLTLVGGALAVNSLLRLPQWSQKASATPLWRLLPGILWAFVPAIALLSIPALTARFADRVFGFANQYKSMLGIFFWLGLTGVLGVVNGIARIVILLRQHFR